MLEKYFNIQDCVEKSLKIKFALKSPWILPFTEGFNSVFGDPNQYKLVCLYLVQQMLHQIKAPQFYTNFLKLISLEMQSSISEAEF